MELHCYAAGYPPPEIYWRRQDNAVLPTNTSIFKGNDLIFPKVTKEHRGTYYCVATNVVGQGARRNVDVEVFLILSMTGISDIENSYQNSLLLSNCCSKNWAVA